MLPYSYDDLPYFVAGGWMVGIGAAWPLLANVLVRIFGPRPAHSANANAPVQERTGKEQLKS